MTLFFAKIATVTLTLVGPINLKLELVQDIVTLNLYEIKPKSINKGVRVMTKFF